MIFGFGIFRATQDDIKQVQNIARKFSNELGFVMRVSLERAIEKGELHVAKKPNGDVVGFVNWHRLKKGISTIYEIAVHPEYHHMGIGANLLWSVPAPVRLKVTTDNPANEFYKKMNMRLIETEKGRKRPLNVYELKMQFIYCQGGNKKFPRVASECGVAYGTRSKEKAQSYPFMLDIKWKDYDWNNHIQKIKDYRPVMACVPDYERLDQKADMLAKVEELRQLGVIRIVVIPKFSGAVKDIPNDCIIGISVPSSYAGFVPNDEDIEYIKGRMVHLLGGSPQSQRAFYDDYTRRGVQVISADGNGFQKNASSGVFFEGGKWIAPKHVRWVHGDMHNTMIYSLNQIVVYLNEDRQTKQLSLFD